MLFCQGIADIEIVQAMLLGAFVRRMMRLLVDTYGTRKKAFYSRVAFARSWDSSEA